MQRWLRRPTGSNWGEFGNDDQIGRMNLVTPARRLAALREVREGLAFTLSLPLDYPKRTVFPTRRPPRLEALQGRDGNALYDWTFPDGGPDVVNEDRVALDLQYSTQWDGLSHYGAAFDADGDGISEHIFYNGYRSDAHFVQPRDGQAPAALALGIERLSRTCVQGRGVLVDLRVAGEGPHRLVGAAALALAMEQQGATVEEGDFLCIYTGYADLLLRDGAEVADSALAICPGLNGGDPALLDWITASGVSAICADNPMVEKMDGITRCLDAARLPLHEHCLVKLGIHLGEFWWFGGLAKALSSRERAHFLLTAPPLDLPGAVGSPVAPVATI